MKRVSILYKENDLETKNLNKDKVWVPYKLKST